MATRRPGSNSCHQGCECAYPRCSGSFRDMKRILVTGARGQLGTALARVAPEDVQCFAYSRSELDITDSDAVRQAIETIEPDCVINAAAYTAVDNAESEPEAADALNHEAVASIAATCAQLGTELLHVSTDFVFDGKDNSPIPPDAVSNPLGTYGKSKRLGELAALAHPGTTTIVRTSWLYGPGGSNFVRTMLRLMQQRQSLSVVCDQLGSPTHVDGLARALLSIAKLDRKARPSIAHWCDAGTASWYDLAEATRLIACKRWPDRSWASIRPIPTSEYPTPALRPPYSVLDATETYELIGYAPSWMEQLHHALTSDPETHWLDRQA
ncbi:MAG: dTDP-4-dehydrorhamnose reductase [Algiphilus sp.]